jgi:hypothetical protein
VSHARGEVLLGEAGQAPAGAGSLPEEVAACGMPAASVYRESLFHGPALQVIERVELLGPGGIVAQVRGSGSPEGLDERPLRRSWLTDPVAVDAGFQLLVLWTSQQFGSGSLPTAVGRYRQFAREFPGGRLRVVARASRPASHRASADIDWLAADGSPVARVEGYECVIDESLNAAFRRNRLHRVARAPR